MDGGYEILIVGDERALLPAPKEPTRSVYLTRLNGSRARKLRDQGQSFWTNNQGDYRRDDLIMLGLCYTYLREGVQRFRQLDAALQAQALAWFTQVAGDPGAHNAPLIIGDLSFTCAAQYGPSFNIMLNRVDFFAEVREKTLTGVHVKESLVLHGDNRVWSDGFHYLMPRSFTLDDSLKGAIGQVLREKWHLN